MEYEYRDAGNYKLFGAIVFENRSQLSINKIRKEIENWLIDGEFFIPDDYLIPALQFDRYIPELDHEWHRITNVFETEEPPTLKADVLQLLNFIHDNDL